MEPSSIIHRTEITDSFTQPTDVVNFVTSSQLASNSLIEVFDYYATNAGHSAIIPLVDLWLGLRVDQNPLISGGTININNVDYLFSTVTETDGFTYWRASVEPGQFNMYNITNVNMSLKFSSMPTTPYIYSSYGMIIKGKPVDPDCGTYRYAFDNIEFGLSNILGISHSLNGVETILYDNGNLNYDLSRLAFNCVDRTYTINKVLYIKYANHYYDWMYDNSKRTVNFLGTYDNIKAQGKTNEIFNYVTQNNILTSKMYDNELYTEFNVEKNGHMFLGLDIAHNTNIKSVDYIINDVHYPAFIVTDTYTTGINTVYSSSFYRLTYEPLYLFLMDNTVRLEVVFIEGTNPREMVTLSYGYFIKNDEITVDPISATPIDTNIGVYYENMEIKIGGNTLRKLQEGDLAFYHTNNIIKYVYQDRTIIA